MSHLPLDAVIDMMANGGGALTLKGRNIKSTSSKGNYVERI